MTASLVAVATWLACLPVAYALPRLGPFDPFQLRAAMIPVEGGAVLLVAVAIAARRIGPELASALGAGLFAGWAAFTMRLALHGTPYGFNGLDGDLARMAAMANRYAFTWHSADGIVPSVPSQYPFLYPWLAGHAAALTHIPAWRLLGPVEIVTTSAAVVAGFVLWRRLLPGPVALAVSLPMLLVYSLPSKADELVALAVFTPWALATFARPPRGRLHWLPAGVIGGLTVLWYPEYLFYGAMGIVALGVLTWRASPSRAGYLRHVALTVAVAAVVGSFYLVPYLGWSLAHPTQQTGDLFQGTLSQAGPLPFLAATPVAALELIGLAGLVWYRRRAWWAAPMLVLTASCYAYWLLFLAVFTATGHTGLLEDTPRLTGTLLSISGVLTITRAAPGVVRRLAPGVAAPPGTRVLALSLLAAWTGVSAWQAWMPGGPASGGGRISSSVTSSPNAASDAFAYPLPDGRYPRFSPSHHGAAALPVDRIAADVGSVYRARGSPATASFDERIFAFRNWPGYIPVDVTAAGSTTDWSSRYAVLARLARTPDPGAFARESAHTPYGGIDVFILHDSGRGWTWTPYDYPSSGTLVFRPRQFSPGHFAVFTHLPDDVVLAVRRK